MLFGLSPRGSRILRRALPPGLPAPFRALSLRLPQACACAIQRHRATRRLRCLETASFSAAFRRLAPVDRLPNNRVKRSGFRRRSLFRDLPAGVRSKLPLPAAPTSVAVSSSGSAPVSRTGDPLACSARTEPATEHSACAKRTVRLDAPQPVSARFHAVVSATHCRPLTPQTDPPCTRPPVPHAWPDEWLSPPIAVVPLAALQLSCSAASSGSCLRSPDYGLDCDNRKSLAAFTAISLRPFRALHPRSASRR